MAFARYRKGCSCACSLNCSLWRPWAALPRKAGGKACGRGIQGSHRWHAHAPNVSVTTDCCNLHTTNMWATNLRACNTNFALVLTWIFEPRQNLSHFCRLNACGVLMARSFIEKESEMKANWFRGLFFSSSKAGPIAYALHRFQQSHHQPFVFSIFAFHPPLGLHMFANKGTSPESPAKPLPLDPNAASSKRVCTQVSPCPAQKLPARPSHP